MKIKNVQQGVILDRSSGYKTQVINNNFYFGMKDDLTNRFDWTGGNVPLNEWHYFVVSWNAPNVKIYQDGVNLTSTTWSFLPKNATGVAMGGNGYFLNGLLDDVKIYDAGLSSSQIKQNYIAGLNSMLSNGSISKEEYNERINTLAYE